MATEAQIAGEQAKCRQEHRTEDRGGQEKTRGNALKHGGRAKVVDLMPVLPHEDPEVLRERIQPPGSTTGSRAMRPRTTWPAAAPAWPTSSSAPSGPRSPTWPPASATPTKREAAKAVRTVNELGRRLYGDGRDGLLASLPKPPWVDDPELLVARLEATAAGCRWLIGRWGQLRTLLDRGKAWLPGDVFRFFRLQGQNVYEADQDPVINGLLLALDVISPGVAGYYQKYFRGLSSSRDPAFKWTTEWRELADRPADRPTAVAIVRGVIDERVGRLEGLIGRAGGDRRGGGGGGGRPGVGRPRAGLRAVRAAPGGAGPGAAADGGGAAAAAEGCGSGESRGIDSPGPLHGAGGCGGGSPSEPTPQECQGPAPGASASTPPPQPRGEDGQRSADREAQDG